MHHRSVQEPENLLTVNREGACLGFTSQRAPFRYHRNK
jgi:hypothetical protein